MAPFSEDLLDQTFSDYYKDAGRARRAANYFLDLFFLGVLFFVFLFLVGFVFIKDMGDYFYIDVICATGGGTALLT